MWEQYEFKYFLEFFSTLLICLGLVFGYLFTSKGKKVKDYTGIACFAMGSFSFLMFIIGIIFSLIEGGYLYNYSMNFSPLLLTIVISIIHININEKGANGGKFVKYGLLISLSVIAIVIVSEILIYDILGFEWPDYNQTYLFMYIESEYNILFWFIFVFLYIPFFIGILSHKVAVKYEGVGILTFIIIITSIVLLIFKMTRFYAFVFLLISFIIARKDLATRDKDDPIKELSTSHRFSLISCIISGAILVILIAIFILIVLFILHYGYYPWL